ncbi:MAG: ATP synthase F0 subunit B [Lutibacter sp.]|nr:MAG: ATP synthase F0 subunit B [Lutibacter sp.]
MELITPAIGLIFWTTVTFLILLFLLKKMAWKPILGAVSEREEGIKNALASADQARKEMQNLTADNERILKEARAEREAMMKEAREIKEAMINEAKEEAKSEATKIMSQAQAAIQSEKQAAIAEIKTQVAELSVGIAEKVVRKELANDSAQSQLIEQLLNEVTIS